MIRRANLFEPHAMSEPIFETRALERIASDASQIVNWKSLADTAMTQVVDPLQRYATAFTENLREQFTNPATRPTATRQALVYTAGAVVLLGTLRWFRRQRS